MAVLQLNTIKGTNFLYCAILFLTFVCMGGVAMLALPGNLEDLILIFLCLIAIFKYGGNLNSSYLRCVFILFAFFIISAIFTGTNLLNYKSFFLRLSIVALIYWAFNSDLGKIKASLIQVLWIIVYLALINIVLYTFIPGAYRVFTHESGYTINTIAYIFNYSGNSSQGFLRNPGIFWEPGILQMAINLLIFIILIENEDSFKKVIVPAIVLFSTASTTGYVLFVFIVMYRLFLVNKFNKKTIWTGIVILGLSFFIIPFIGTNVSNKIEGEGSMSAASRTYDYLMGTQIIIDHPILGLGFDQDKYTSLTTNIDLGRYDDINLDLERGNSNTIVSMAVFLGLPFCLWFLYSLFHQRLFRRRLPFFVIFVVSLLSEPLFVTVFIYLIAISYLKPTHKIKVNNAYNTAN